MLLLVFLLANGFAFCIGYHRGMRFIERNYEGFKQYVDDTLDELEINKTKPSEREKTMPSEVRTLNTQVLADGIRRGRLATLMTHNREQATRFRKEPERRNMYLRRWSRCRAELLKLL